MLVICTIFSLFYIINGCPTGTIQGPNANSCFKLFPNPQSFFVAQENCVNYGGSLASVLDVFTNSFLMTQAQEYFIDSSTYWLGGTTTLQNGTWSWVDHNKFQYINWEKGQPTSNYGNLCLVQLVKNSFWNSIDCSTMLPYACEITFQSTQPSPTQQNPTTKASDPGCPSGGWSAYNDKCYKLYDGTKTFKDAENTCEIAGGNLVSIHSADENNKILDIASSYKNDASWIGMTWIAHGSCSNGYSCDNSSYTISCPTWIDGTSVDYFNLIGSCMGTQQYGCCVAFFCTVICPRNSLACTSSEYGMWGVADCMAASTQSVIPTSFICESKRTTQPSPTPPTTTNPLYKYCDNGWILNQETNKCYTRVEGKKTFADASSYCRGEGGELASIHSADENEFILDLSSNNQDIGSWIGLEWISHGQCISSGDSCTEVGQEPSCPYWSDGTTVQYFNLGGTCTNYNQGCCVYFLCTFMCNRVISDACTTQEEFGRWGTADCTSTSNDSAIPTSFICEKPNDNIKPSRQFFDIFICEETSSLSLDNIA